jgi:adenylate cyclase
LTAGSGGHIGILKSRLVDMFTSSTSGSRLVAVMFADLTGSTTLYVEHGDQDAYFLTARSFELFEQEVGAAGGRTLKRTGDGILAVFADPKDAFAAAVRIREEFSSDGSAFERFRIKARCGVSYGKCILADGDVYGDVVNVAARLVARAVVDEILLSAPACEQLDAATREVLRPIGDLNLRNRPGEVLVYKYVGAGEDATRAHSEIPELESLALELELGGRLFVLSEKLRRLAIGRSAMNDLVVDDVAVSRHHALIEARDDRFVLLDQSTNGTTVRFDSGQTLRLNREEAILVGNGRIILGGLERIPIEFRVAQERASAE